MQDDQFTIVELASLYKADVENHENKAYVARANELREEREAQLTGKGNAFGTRTDRGWAPPTLDDVDAEQSGGAR